MDISAIKGIIPPLITPVLENEDIDEGALRKIINHCIETGLHGVFIGGTMGESLATTQEQRDASLRIALDEAKDRIPVLGGVMDSSTRRVIENIKRFEQMGGEYVVVSPVFYAVHSSPNETIRHFEEISKNTEAKVLAYNIPGYTGKNLTPDLVFEISKIDKVVGIKDSSGNYVQFLRLLNHFKGTSFKVFQGLSALAGISILQGADGAVLGYAPLFPEIYVDLYEASLRKDLDRVQQLAPLIEQIAGINNLSTYSISATKYAMSLLGFSHPRMIRPSEPVKPEEEEIIRKAVNAINEEYEKIK